MVSFNYSSEKLKRTEEDILKCKERIEELTKQKGTIDSDYNTDYPMQTETIGRGRFQHRMQEMGQRPTPWATHHHVTLFLFF